MTSVAVWLPRASRVGMSGAFRVPAITVNASLRSSTYGIGRSLSVPRRFRSTRTRVTLSSTSRAPCRTYWSRPFSTTPTAQKSTAPEEESPAFSQHDFQSVTASIKDSRTILIDVREPSELETTGIIPGAVNIPLKSSPDAFFLPADEFEDRFGYANPALREGSDGQKVIIYCLAGVRARAAAELARQAGYKGEIGVYDGSWRDWEANKGKVAKWEGGRP